MVKPITPKEALGKKQEQLPDEVLEAFNELIAANLKDRESTFKATDAVNLIRQKLEIKSDAIYEKGYLDIEQIYRKAGWEVEYDQPAYCESYPATYTFRAKRK